MLNDPFELSPNISEYQGGPFREFWQNLERIFGGKRVPKQALWLMARDQIKDEMLGAPALEQLFQHCVMLSLSGVRDDLLMWAHYGQWHTGYVIGFDLDDPYFSPSLGKTAGARAVVYSRERPEMIVDEYCIDDMKKGTADFLYVKDERWKYENEIRVFADAARANHVITADTNGIPLEHDIFLFDFPPESVKEVILGWRMPYDAMQLLKVLLLANYPSAELFTVRINERSFGLKLELENKEPDESFAEQPVETIRESISKLYRPRLPESGDSRP